LLDGFAKFEGSLHDFNLPNFQPGRLAASENAAHVIQALLLLLV